MISRIFLIVMVLLFSAQAGWSVPPSAIRLAYDDQGKILLIEIDHKSHDLLKHRIRQVTVYMNGAEFSKVFPVKQATAEGLSLEVMLDAVSGDTISVKAICSEAGFKEENLLIP